MTTPTLDTVRPSWERKSKITGMIRPNGVPAPSKRRNNRPSGIAGELLTLSWENIPEDDYQTICATYEQVGGHKVVAFTPADEVSARGWRVEKFSSNILSGQNFKVEATLKSLPGSVVT